MSNPGALTSIRYEPAGAVTRYVPSPVVRASWRKFPQRSARLAPTSGAPLGSATFPESDTRGAAGSGRHDSTNETGFCAMAIAGSRHASRTVVEGLMVKLLHPMFCWASNGTIEVGMLPESVCMLLMVAVG